MLDLLSVNGMSDVLSPGATFLAGSKLAWNGWLPVNWLYSTMNESKAYHLVMSPGYLDNAVISIQSTFGLQPYLKIVGTLGFDSNVDSFARFIEEQFRAAGYPLTRQGIVVDYAVTGSQGANGDATVPSTGGGGVTGSGLDCWLSLDCLASKLGVTPTTAALVGAGAVLLLVVVLKR